jgi:hypothetical protein
MTLAKSEVRPREAARRKGASGDGARRKGASGDGARRKGASGDGARRKGASLRGLSGVDVPKSAVGVGVGCRDVAEMIPVVLEVRCAT